MAVRLEGTIKRFIGASTDTKPVVGRLFDGSILADRDLPPGSSFLESDTGRVYRWNGFEWTHPNKVDDSETWLAVLVRLDEIDEKLSAILS